MGGLHSPTLPFTSCVLAKTLLCIYDTCTYFILGLWDVVLDVGTSGQLGSGHVGQRQGPLWGGPPLGLPTDHNGIS